MKAIIDGDIVVGIGSGDLPGVEIPDALGDLPAARLRYVNGALVDALTLQTWYVDEAGTRHAVPGAGRQTITAGFSDPLERDGSGGWRIVDQLARAKERRKADIDAAAERERLRYITPGAGQAMTYQAKVDEARRLVDDANPDAAHYPLLSAEIGITAASLAEVGEVVMQAYQQWLGLGGAIEAARLGAKRAIEQAQTLADLEAVAVAWPGA